MNGTKDASKDALKYSKAKNFRQRTLVGRGWWWCLLGLINKNFKNGHGISKSIQPLRDLAPTQKVCKYFWKKGGIL